MTDSPANPAALQHKIADLEQRVADLTNHALVQNKIAEALLALDHRAAEHEARLDRNARELAQLNMWHNGRLFAHIARLFPKTRSVIFLSADFFGDNIKYAFLAFRAVAEKQGIACHFLINNPAQRAMLIENSLPCLPALSQWTLEHFRILLQAKVLVAFDHFTPFLWQPPLPYFLLQGARLVQLWHGIPYKEIGLLYSDSGANPLEGIKLASTGPADLLVAPGKSMREDWARWFAFREFAPVGYPRNDALFREPTAEDLINVDMDLLRDLKAAKVAGRKVIFYVPTWRDKIGAAWFERANIAPFAKWCEDKGHFFFVKTHPIEQEGFAEVKKKTPGVRFARPDSDLYPLLRSTDMLVTDYSSVALDYLHLDRPLVFYRPDHAEYRANCRGFLPDYERFTAGAEAADIAALCRAVETALAGKDEWAKQRAALRKELFDHHDGKSSARVAELILKQLDMPQELPAGWGP